MKIAVMKNARRFGLANRYRNCETTRKFIRCMMSLALLPGEHIREQFSEALSEIKNDDSLVRSFAEYMVNQWIESSSHPLSSISVYCLNVRTNNDTEGCLNKKVGE